MSRCCASAPGSPGSSRAGGCCSFVRGLPAAEVAALDAAEQAGTRTAEDAIDLYHGTGPEGAANIRSNGIDLGAGRANRDFGLGFYTTRDHAQAASWASQHFGESGTVLHYRVPSSMFDDLSGKVFSWCE